MKVITFCGKYDEKCFNFSQFFVVSTTHHKIHRYVVYRSTKYCLHITFLYKMNGISSSNTQIIDDINFLAKVAPLYIKFSSNLCSVSYVSKVYLLPSYIHKGQ